MTQPTGHIVDNSWFWMGDVFSQANDQMLSPGDWYYDIKSIFTIILTLGAMSNIFHKINMSF